MAKQQKTVVYLKVVVASTGIVPRKIIERELKGQIADIGVYWGEGAMEIKRVTRLPKADVIDGYEVGTHECPHPYH